MKVGGKLIPSLYLHAFEDCPQIPFVVKLTLPYQSFLGSDSHSLQSHQTGQNNAKQNQTKLDFLKRSAGYPPLDTTWPEEIYIFYSISINIRLGIPRSSSEEEVTLNWLFPEYLAKPCT